MIIKEKAHRGIAYKQDRNEKGQNSAGKDLVDKIRPAGEVLELHTKKIDSKTLHKPEHGSADKDFHTDQKGQSQEHEKGKKNPVQETESADSAIIDHQSPGHHQVTHAGRADMAKEDIKDGVNWLK